MVILFCQHCFLIQYMLILLDTVCSFLPFAHCAHSTHDYTAFKNPDLGDDAVVSNDKKCDGGVFCEDGCGCGAADTGDNFCGAPDLDHTSQKVCVCDYYSGGIEFPSNRPSPSSRKGARSGGGLR